MNPNYYYIYSFHNPPRALHHYLSSRNYNLYSNVCQWLDVEEERCITLTQISRPVLHAITDAAPIRFGGPI